MTSHTPAHKSDGRIEPFRTRKVKLSMGKTSERKKKYETHNNTILESVKRKFNIFLMSCSQSVTSQSN